MLADDISEALTRTSGGTIITIEVTPGSKSDVFPSGYNPWRKALGCQISALPVEGKANLAIIRLIADSLSVPKTAVSIRSGGTASQKKVLISGRAFDEILSRLKDLVPR
jgi:uncharacterized protein